jgi:hypothetical protein
LPKQKNPSKTSIAIQDVSPPPPELVRPRNGYRSGDALGVDKLSGPDGGGKSPGPFMPIVDEPLTGPNRGAFGPNARVRGGASPALRPRG